VAHGLFPSPFVAKGKAIEVKDVNKGLIHIIKRKDGLMEITYNDKPLYYYTKDRGKPGSTKGQDVHDEFGKWYLVSPAGKKVKG
jgi:predicted lipoprotein with Yx(FWY)xxD motif